MPDGPRLLADRYRLDAVLGSGGMGQVWRGRDETLGRDVAVKEVRLPRELTDEQRDALCQRMLREARMTARLSHPGVITVYDVVSEDDRPFIVMEMLPVPNLAEEIAESGPLPPHRVAAIGVELLAALHAAHADGIIHRDVKPSNVMLADGRVVLSDFGVAISESDPRMTTTGMIVGSPTYMSPERLRGTPSGPEADLWSLGATLYAAVEGRPPFHADTTMGTVSAVLTDELPPPSVEGPLHDVLVGLLDKDPARRLTTAGVAPLLRRAAEDSGPATAPGADTRTPAHPWAAPAESDTTLLRAGAGTAPKEWAQPESAPLESAPPRRRSGLRPLLLGLAGLAVLAALLVVGWQLSDDEGGSTATPTQESPSATDGTDGTDGTEPTPDGSESTDESDLPAGYRLRDDPLGFQVAVPRGWERRLDGPTRVDFVSPDGTTFLRVDQQEVAGPSAEQAWLDQEPSVAASLSGYERIRIDPVDYRSWDTADWEFTWEGDNGTIHVLNRGIATDTRGFALYVSAPDSAWESDGVPLFETVTETFQPIE